MDPEEQENKCPSVPSKDKTELEEDSSSRRERNSSFKK